MLESLDMTKSITRDSYEMRVQELQLALVRAQRRLIERQIPVVITFEGIDASGKGGAIKRIIAKLDPRGYEVHPIGPPDPHELQYQYLRRFWVQLPAYGRIGIFDRSWYGRVLVERVEKLATKDQWKRAYDEINNFERMLVDDGMVLFKFWIHISAQEQLRRFKQRENDPYKRWKITKDDWRNRDKWDAYIEAAEEMFARTSTPVAPWFVIPGEDKLYARVQVLETVVAGIEKALALPAQHRVKEQEKAAGNGAGKAKRGARSILE
jgi:AMP-polyphosphate phosphotransferase